MAYFPEISRKYYTSERGRETSAIRSRRRREKFPEETLFYSAKQRAARFGVPFTIRVEDIIIPECCPVLGIPLCKGVGRPQDGSPSLDRIVPALGYVPGNIVVMSVKANRIKNDSSIEELKKVLEWLVATIAGKDLSHA